LSDSAQVRSDLFRLATALRELEVTAIMTAERTQEYGEISRYGVEEFVADNVVILRNVLTDEKRRRTIEILKYRGTNHQKGEFPFTIIPNKGAVIIPLSAIELEQKSSNIRITSGSLELDRMCGGGSSADFGYFGFGSHGNRKNPDGDRIYGRGSNQWGKMFNFCLRGKSRTVI
jgi:circadian clock protein KaiC